MTKPLTGSQNSTTYVLTDRSNQIYYLRTIQHVLLKLGIKQVRLRPHPSESINWYLKYVDPNFFKRDEDNLQTSLNKSSLLIGPASTVFLESLISEVNYVVYEPRLPNGMCADSYEAVPPFDGKNSKVPVAENMEELKVILKNKTKLDISVLNDYIATTFDPSAVFDKLEI